MAEGTGKAGTWFSGRDKPGLLGGQEESPEEWWLKPLLMVALVVAFPVAALLFLLVAIPMSARYVRGRWMLPFAGVGWLLLLIRGGSEKVWPAVRDAYPMLIDAAKGRNDMSKAGAIAHLLNTHLPFDLMIGGLLLGGYLWFLNYRTPQWKKPEPTASLLDRWRKRRNVASLQAAQIDSSDGATIGVDDRTGEPVTVDDTSLARHCLVVGGVGSGKTTTSKRILGNRIRRGQPVIAVDLKASLDLPEYLRAMAKRHNRPYYEWSLTGPLHYDPLRHGDPSRRKDLLIGSMEFGTGDSAIFKTVAEDYLQLAFKVGDLIPSPLSTLEDVTSLLDPTALASRLSPYALVRPDLWQQAKEILDDADPVTRSGLRGLRLRLRNMATSVAGPYLSSPPIDPSTGLPRTDLLLDLRKAVEEGAVVCFSIDSSNYEQIASSVAGLIIQDLKTLSSQMRHAGNSTPVQVFIDEFSSVDSVNILGLLAKSRDAGMPVMLATQSLADLMRNEPQFVDQVLDICGTFLVHRVNTFEAAERLALLAGKKITLKEQVGVEAFNSLMAGGRSIGTATGVGRISEEEVFVVDPTAVQQLGTGECYLIAKGKRAEDQSQRLLVVPEIPSRVAVALAKGAGKPPAGLVTEPVQATAVADDPYQVAALTSTGLPDGLDVGNDPSIWASTDPHADPAAAAGALDEQLAAHEPGPRDPSPSTVHLPDGLSPLDALAGGQRLQMAAPPPFPEQTPSAAPSAQASPDDDPGPADDDHVTAAELPRLGSAVQKVVQRTSTPEPDTEPSGDQGQASPPAQAPEPADTTWPPTGQVATPAWLTEPLPSA